MKAKNFVSDDAENLIHTCLYLIDVSRKLPYINVMVISDNFYSHRIAHLYMWSAIGKLLDFQ